jgi:molybdopterin converting factor small subunit
MRVSVLLFASFREMLGTGRLEIDAKEGESLQDVFRALEEREPRLRALRPFTTFAVNREVVDPDTPIRDGDEIALLQPVSGG